jgi:two-component system NtrC family response regulator
METLQGHTWPGNVRELFHSLEQAFVASGDDMTLFAMHLPADIRIKVARTMLDGKTPDPQPDQPPSATASVSEENRLLFGETLPTIKIFKLQMEKAYLEHLIETSGGDVSRILKISKLSRSHFYALLKRHRIDV